MPAERRGWALGIYGLSGLLSTSLAPLAGEFLVRRLGFASFFVWTTLLAGASLAMVARMRDVVPPSVTGTPGLEAVRQGIEELLHLHMVLAFCFGLGTGTVFTFLPTFAELLGVRGLGLFYTAYAAGAMLVRLFGGELIDVRGRRAVIIPSLFVQAAATAILALIALLRHPDVGACRCCRSCSSPASWPAAPTAFSIPRSPPS